ncbi:SDR family NAD(P)-dependent oxidoreductase [Glaciecola siphonariae]|uniref:SDR family NAD(P)-dependent oxidoreductase n=1 Tax=Glaciecola siphonariae TaxID=521012 RepID=A0ABV9LRW9_9ALTE
MKHITQIEKHIENRSIFITGGASGLGLAIASEFAKAGWRVGIFDLNQEHIESAQKQLQCERTSPIFFQGNVANYAELKACIDDFAADGLGVMINNAGIAAGGNFLERTLDDWNKIYQINVFGVVNGCKAALPHLIGNRAILHNVASAAGFMSSPMMASYNSSKAAVVSLTETLIGEYSMTDSLLISVSLPAFFKTNLLASLLASDEEKEAARLLMKYSDYTVEQAVEDILEGIANKQNYIFAPKKLRTLWRFKRFLPNQFIKVLPEKRRKRIELLKAQERDQKS